MLLAGPTAGGGLGGLGGRGRAPPPRAHGRRVGRVPRRVVCCGDVAVTSPPRLGLARLGAVLTSLHNAEHWCNRDAGAARRALKAFTGRFKARAAGALLNVSREQRLHSRSVGSLHLVSRRSVASHCLHCAGPARGRGGSACLISTELAPRVPLRGWQVGRGMRTAMHCDAGRERRPLRGCERYDATGT